MSALASTLARTSIGSLLSRSARLPLVTRGTRVLFVGEHHAQSGVIAAQASALRACSDELLEASRLDGSERGLHVVFEHFSVAQTPLLQSFGQRAITFEELWDSYQATGQEGFHLPTYRPVLDAFQEAAARDPRLSVRGSGGFIPRQRARDFVGHPPQTADDVGAGTSLDSLLHRAAADGMLLPAALTVAVADLPRMPGLIVQEAASAGAATGTLAPVVDDSYGKLSACIAASAAHRSFFFSLLRGEALPRSAASAAEAYSSSAPASAAAASPADASADAATPVAAAATAARGPLHPDNPSRILPAQAIKDMVAACAVYTALAQLPPAGGTVIVLCGKGHCDYGFGIPERLLALLAAAPIAGTATGSSTAAAAEGAPACVGGEGRGASAEAIRHGEDAGGELLIMTCCEGSEAEAALQPAYLPDGSVRRIAHAVIPFTPDPEEEEEEDGVSTTEGKK